MRIVQPTVPIPEFVKGVRFSRLSEGQLNAYVQEVSILALARGLPFGQVVVNAAYLGAAWERAFSQVEVKQE